MITNKRIRVQLDISETARRNLHIYMGMLGERSASRALDDILTNHMRSIARAQFGPGKEVVFEGAKAEPSTASA